MVDSPWFNFTIYCIIFANTVTLALYRYDQSDEQAQFLLICDIVFSIAFILELLAKLIGLGFKNYLKDPFNVLDGIIVAISIIDLALILTLDNDQQADVLSAFRALRLLRMVKLARIWKAFQEILSRMVQSLIDVSNFTLLLLLFLFIFALLGSELFAHTVYFDVEGNMIMGKEDIQEAFASG